MESLMKIGVFIGLGLFGLFPCIHFIITFGSYKVLNEGALNWLILMAVLYVTGASFYIARIPERFFPGQFDIWVKKFNF